MYMENFRVIMSEFTGGDLDANVAELTELGHRFQAAMEQWIRNHGKCGENDRNSGPTPNPKSPNEVDSSRPSPDQQKPREIPPSKGAGSIGSGTSRSRDSGSTKQAAIKWRACMEPCMAGASDSPSVIGMYDSVTVILH